MPTAAAIGVTAVAPPAARRRPVHRRSHQALVLAAVLVGVSVVAALVRVWIFGHAALNSDEAVVGLMAGQIQHGHVSAFYWGQDYGGVEPYVVAVLFAVFGASPFTLTLTASLLAAAAAVVVWRIGVRVLPPGAAVSAAVLAWIWPECTVWNSTREFGFRQAALVLGLLVVLQSLRIRGSARDVSSGRARDVSSGRARDVSQRAGAREVPGAVRVLDWLGLGLLVGVGWWSSPELVYFLLPAALALWPARRAVHPRGVAAAAGLAVGVLPWILASVDDHWGTLHGAQAVPLQHSTYGHRLGLFFTHVLPMLLGLRVEGAGRWLGSRPLGLGLSVVLGVVILVAMAVVALRAPAARLLLAFLVPFPFLYAVFPTSAFWNDGRYGLYLPPMLALTVAGAVFVAAPRPAARAVVAVVAVLATVSTVASFNAGFDALVLGATVGGMAGQPQPRRRGPRRRPRPRRRPPRGTRRTGWGTTCSTSRGARCRCSPSTATASPTAAPASSRRRWPGGSSCRRPRSRRRPTLWGSRWTSIPAGGPNRRSNSGCGPGACATR